MKYLEIHFREPLENVKEIISPGGIKRDKIKSPPSDPIYRHMLKCVDIWRVISPVNNGFSVTLRVQP